MRFFSVECEAPGGGYGPKARLKYNSNRAFIQEIEYLDLIFDVWLGSELVQDVGRYCATKRLCDYLESNSVKGISSRSMAVTVGEHVKDRYPGRIIPQFRELILPRGAQGEETDRWVLESASVPDAEMFSGIGLPLFVNERVMRLLVAYGVSGLEIEEASLA